MNKIHIPIRNVHLETVFEGRERTTYALLEPAGDVTPLRVQSSDFRSKLHDRFSPELSDEEQRRAAALATGGSGAGGDHPSL